MEILPKIMQMTLSKLQHLSGFLPAVLSAASSPTHFHTHLLAQFELLMINSLRSASYFYFMTFFQKAMFRVHAGKNLARHGTDSN